MQPPSDSPSRPTTSYERTRAERRELNAVLRLRTPHATATWLLVAVNVGVYLAMALDGGRRGSFTTATLVKWGALYGPRLADGEWWRLLTATFLHVNAPHLAFNMLALAIVGPIVERLVGRRTFLAFYVAAGLAGASSSLWRHELTVAAGASGSIIGLYGVLLLMMFERSPAPDAAGDTAPVARWLLQAHLQSSVGVIASTLLLGWWDPRVDNAGHLGGFVVGCVCGWIAGRRIETRLPEPRMQAAALALALTCCAVSLAAQHKVTDIRPEMAEVFTLDSRAMVQYSRLAKAKTDAAAMARTIDEDIVPAFSRARTKLAAIAAVADEQVALREDLDKYLRLRQSYWHLRAAEMRNEPGIDQQQVARADVAADVAMRRLLNWR